VTSNGLAALRELSGSSIIEKHFTLERSGGGLENSFSMQSVALFQGFKTAWQPMAQVTYGRKSSNQGHVKF
jgi:sialic acid synthase SpsE